MVSMMTSMTGSIIDPLREDTSPAVFPATSSTIKDETPMADLRQDALDYHHLNNKPGKIAILPTKPLDTQRDLALAYSPGVAEPVLEIEKDPSLAYKYTSKGNLVGVISNGTAILGLGDRGALASKP